MEYRKLPHGDEMISIIGMGTSSLGESPKEEMIQTINYAIDHGINYFDLASGYASSFEAFGEVLKTRRKEVYLQIHFGALYFSGEYGWTTDLKQIKKSIEWQLKTLHTDYIDFGFIHCLDEQSDIDSFIGNGVLDYIKELKDQGIIHHIGMSSHTPATVHKILDLGIIDMLMFSINPAYDYHKGEYAFGEFDERANLYNRCEREGVAISVMKPFSGGQLLDQAKSPFHHALTQTQCIQYALDKPAVVTVLPGCRNTSELKDVLTYLESNDEQRDYTILSTFEEAHHTGTCVYCKHCHPCPAGLDIALINKYYDLTKMGDSLAKDHYLNLDKKASDCIHCGHCNSRCPFKVQQKERMNEIASYFGV